LQFARDSQALLENATGTVASKEISLPSGWVDTHALFVTIGGSKRMITRRREISVKDLERYSDYAGDIPYYYYWEFSGTKKIKFVGSTAMNGAAYDLYYFEAPTTALADTTDVSILPEEFRQAPVYKAASNLVLQIGMYQRAQTLLALYERAVQQAKAQAQMRYVNVETPAPDLNVMDSTPTDVQGQPGDWW
jgi:hypothetical protein